MARILIVDDSPSQLVGMKRIVEKLGHEVVTAEDGAAGVEAAKRELPDLILMDVVMPNLNGFQATRTISQGSEDEPHPDHPGHDQGPGHRRVWGMRQGAKAYVTKPIDEAELTRTINEYLPAANSCDRRLSAANRASMRVVAIASPGCSVAADPGRTPE